MHPDSWRQLAHSLKMFTEHFFNALPFFGSLLHPTLKHLIFYNEKFHRTGFKISDYINYILFLLMFQIKDTGIPKVYRKICSEATVKF